MARFPVNNRRADPYKNFRFRLKWDGRYVAGVRKASALTRAGGAGTQPITLEGGVTHDTDFEAWASTAWRSDDPAARTASDLLVEMVDEAGRVAATFRIRRARVAEFSALPDLDASANAVTIQSLVLHHEGFERDLPEGGAGSRANPGGKHVRGRSHA